MCIHPLREGFKKNEIGTRTQISMGPSLPLKFGTLQGVKTFYRTIQPIHLTQLGQPIGHVRGPSLLLGQCPNFGYF